MRFILATSTLVLAFAVAGCSFAYKSMYKETNHSLHPAPVASADVKVVKSKDELTSSFTELGSYKAVVETTKGTFELEFLADRAPETVRNFLRLAHAGVYDGVGVHRVATNFVIQTGALAFRAPLTPAQNKLVHNLAPEFSNTPNEFGLVSMARGEDPASAQTSFFICIGNCSGLDGKYTAFAKVSAGHDVVRAIAAVAVDGETPRETITMVRVRVTKK